MTITYDGTGQIVAVQHPNMSEALIFQVSDKATRKWIIGQAFGYVLRVWDEVLPTSEWDIEYLDEMPEEGYDLWSHIVGQELKGRCDLPDSLHRELNQSQQLRYDGYMTQGHHQRLKSKRDTQTSPDNNKKAGLLSKSLRDYHLCHNLQGNTILPLVGVY